jgi:2-hydroxychromene-2-carboxylate isomerase
MPAIEFWFDFASNYSYLSMLRIRALAAADVDIILKPFLLGPIFKAQGWDNSPFVLQPVKGRYVWRDMQRQCDKYGLPWRQPAAFPRNGLLAARVALQANGQPWLGAFCEQVMLANFADDREIGEPALLASLLTQLGQDGAALLAAASQPGAKQALRERGIEAQSRGIFGAPTFFVGADMFWGDDRLEDAIALAVRHRSATRHLAT